MLTLLPDASFRKSTRMPRETQTKTRNARATSVAKAAASPPGAPTAPLSGRAIVTIIGSDRVGIIAGIANVIAEANVNILDISQSVIREFFTMIMMVDLSAAKISFEALADNLSRKGTNLGVKVEIQREEIFKAMHRI
jgi:ACT domain-containing protein